MIYYVVYIAYGVHNDRADRAVEFSASTLGPVLQVFKKEWIYPVDVDPIEPANGFGGMMSGLVKRDDGSYDIFTVQKRRESLFNTGFFFFAVGTF